MRLTRPVRTARAPTPPNFSAPRAPPPPTSPQYNCVFCGKDTVKRHATGIWNCSACKKVRTGGAYILATAAAATVRSNIARLRKVEEL